jgi:predicted RecA/RadA family phage recombinase
MSLNHIVLADTDDVAIALADLPAGTSVAGVTLLEHIQRAHKIALRAIAQGDLVRRYGQIIGQATVDIAAGAHVHVQNLGMATHSAAEAGSSTVADVERNKELRTFMGAGVG